MIQHRWSGWPGAWCMKCGAEDMMELALGHGVYDPCTEEWLSEEVRQKYMQQECPVTDEEYEKWLSRSTPTS